MIPHKISKYRGILDLSFALKLSGYNLLLVNDVTQCCAPNVTVDQIGTCIPHLIMEMNSSPQEDGPIFLSKLNIKDDFWIMMCELGQE